MKRLALLTIMMLSVFVFTNCAEELEFNTPSIQGQKDGRFWRANYQSADIDFGGFLIEGGDNYEKLQLITATDTRGTFQLGGTSQSMAIFTDADGTVYSTANAPHPSVSVYPADGEIIVEDITNANPKEVIGTFWFNAYTADGMKTVNFNKGVFYKVSLVGGLTAGTNEGDCMAAQQTTALAAQAYAGITTSDPNYTSFCNAFKDALNAQISACGDTGGALQATLDSLGDCTP
ncbi:MAG TPA: DUF6252 family protein [Flavobacteriaceae bacterium]|nr:DUF6252 family protein [Flavobacteriaceae bacterium]